MISPIWDHRLAELEHSRPYLYALAYYGFYPLFMAFVWILQSLVFRFRQERTQSADGPEPFVSVIVPAYNEEAMIGNTLDALEQVAYSNFEIIVVNDGSSDRTAELVRSRLGNSRIRLLDKVANEGKAMALNDAVPLCRGEIIVVIDADIAVTQGVLKAIVPHFLSPRVAAVTGNPRVANRHTLLQTLQAIEFSAIISMQRRAQRIWGRVMTVSGAIFAVRRTALIEVGMFTPSMATEDIDLTWRLQMQFWDVRYEPKAVVWMQAPPTLGELWKQRRRWARGLAQVLKRHSAVPRRWKMRRLWPVWYEACASITWAYIFVAMTLYWIGCRVLGHHPYGASPIPNFWGMVVGTACLLQLTIGALVDREYDPAITRSMPEMIYYPLIYWMLMSLITSIYTIEALAKRQSALQTWSIQRRSM